MMSVGSHLPLQDELLVSARVLRELVAAMERAGVPRDAFLLAARLAPEALADLEARWPVSAMTKWTELAVDLRREPAFGLHWGEWLTNNMFEASSFSLYAGLLAHATTLRQAFALAFQFSELLIDDSGMQLVERDDVVELHGGYLPHASLRVRRIASEMRMLCFHQMLLLFGAADRIRYVGFEYAAPSYRGEYTRCFGALERFDRAFTGIVFERSVMDVPMAHADPDIQHSLRMLAEQRIERLRSGATFALQARDLLAQQAAPAQVSMRTLAAWLNISARSVNRRLSEEGWSYRALVEAACAKVARRRLAQGHSIRETAALMGFSEPSAFHRAFKRWTGTTPAKFLAQRC